MQKSFDYFFTKRAEGQLDIDDIGNCAISAFTDLGYHYMLISKTNCGETTILIFGPILVGTKEILNNCSMSYQKREYNEKWISKTISNFLSNPQITQAMPVEESSLYDQMVDLRDYVK